MILIACIDDDYGMMFNGRRQSQDCLLRQRIIKLVDGAPLWMSHYSASQFAEDGSQINVDDACMSEAAEGEYCFVETIDPAPFQKWIERIVLYKWNRKYPSDMKLTIQVPGPDWILARTSDFQGSSHEKITEEVFERTSK